MPQINLGSFTTIGGKQVANGLNSGLDVASLINASVEAKRIPVAKLEDKIDFNDNKIEAFNKLQNLILKLQEASNKLRRVVSTEYINNEDNVFSSRQALVSINSNEEPSQYLQAVANNGVAATSYDIIINQLAKSMRQQSRAITDELSIVQAAGVHDDINKLTAGVFQINSIDNNGSASTVNINIDTDDNLNNIIAKINNYKDSTGISAYTIRPGNNDFRIILESEKTGTNNVFSITDNDNVLNGIFSYSIDSSSINFPASNTDITQSIGDHSLLTQFTSGNIAINGTIITIADNSSLDNIATAINAQRSITGVFALVNEGNSGEFNINLLSEPGVNSNYIITDTDNIFNNVFANDVSQHSNLQLQSAQDAQMTIHGNIAVTSQTNEINGSNDDAIIPGVTLLLEKITSPGDELTLKIERDASKVIVAIDEMLSAYNDVKKFATKQTQRDENFSYLDTAILRNDTVLAKLMDNLYRELHKLTDGLSNYSHISDIGITFENIVDENDEEYKNLLQIDTLKLQQSLLTNPDEVKKLFEMDYMSSSPHLILGQQRANLPSDVSNITINIDISRPSDQVIQATYIQNGNSITIDASFLPSKINDLTLGGVIEGNDNTIFAGFKFRYQGTGNETISLDIRQGLADRMYNYLNEYKDSIEGTIHKVINDIKDRTIYITSDIERKNEELSKYTDTLKNKYAQMEAAIAKANHLLQYLDIQQKAWENN